MPCRLLKKFPEVSRKKGHLLFTYATSSSLIVWRAIQMVLFNPHNDPGNWLHDKTYLHFWVT